MAGRRRETMSLGGALAAHALMFAWLVSGDAPAPLHFAEAPPPAAVDLAEDEAVPGDAPGPLAAMEPSATAPRGPRPAPVEPHSSEASEAASSRSSAGYPGPPSPSSEPAASLATLSSDALGIGGHNPFIGSLPDAPSSSRASQPPVDNVAPGIQQSLRDSLRDRDHDVGLDVGGPVVSIAEELTRPSPTPVNSHAVFEVVADAGGNVTAVHLLDASEGWGEWEKIASSLAGALKSHPLRVPPGAAGLAFSLEITSRWQLPSGHDPSTEVSVMNVPTKKARPGQKRPVKIDLLNIDPKVVEAPTYPGVSAPMEMPSQVLQLGSIFRSDFDVTDLVPRPSRVVHARVVRERTL